MRSAITPLFILLAFFVLAGAASNRVLEYRSMVVAVASEKGERRFNAHGIVIPLWMTHRNWNPPVEPGKPREWARIDVQNGFFARAGYSMFGAVMGGIVFPLVLISIALFWAFLLFRYRGLQRSTSK